MYRSGQLFYSDSDLRRELGSTQVLLESKNQDLERGRAGAGSDKKVSWTACRRGSKLPACEVARPSATAQVKYMPSSSITCSGIRYI